MRTTWSFHCPGQIVFGRGAIDGLDTLLCRRGLSRVLIVTDAALVRAGAVDKIHGVLERGGIAVGVFDGGRAEPSIDVADRAVEAARRFRPGAILGLGGGSNMDLAKFTATVLAHGGAPSDYFGFDKVPGPVMPLVCVATTAGTGSEVSHSAVLTDTKVQLKVSGQSNYMRPALAVVDPELTLTCPRQATADAGIDALVHAVEAMTAVDYADLDVPPGDAWPYDGRHPLGRCLAEKAIELVGRHLRTAVGEGDNIQAREGMALAALLAGLAFSNCGVALVHALEYPIGGALGCSHGAGNGLLLPYVMRFNLPVRKAAFARIAGLLGEDVQGLTEERAAERAVAAVEKLKQDIGIPERIRDLGGAAEQLPGFAEKALAIKRLVLLNPRRPTQEDLLAILRSAL